MNNQHSISFTVTKLIRFSRAADWPYPVHSVFNPAATMLRDGTTLLLCRVEDRRGHSHLCAARSANGVDNWQIDSQPTFAADPDNFPEELWGIEDARITYVPNSVSMPSSIPPLRVMVRAWPWHSPKISSSSSAMG